MNWKRGLTRIYVVLWIVCAVIGLLFAAQTTSQGIESRKRTAAFLKDHRHLTLTDLQQLPLDTLKARVAPQVVEFEGFLVRFSAEVSDDSMLKVLKSYSADSLRTTLAKGEPLGRERYSAIRKAGLSDQQIADFRLENALEAELHGVQADANSDAVTHPVTWVLGSWGLWAALCLAAPTLILWTLRWIASGFSPQEGEKR